MTAVCTFQFAGGEAYLEGLQRRKRSTTVQLQELWSPTRESHQSCAEISCASLPCGSTVCAPPAPCSASCLPRRVCSWTSLPSERPCDHKGIIGFQKRRSGSTVQSGGRSGSDLHRGLVQPSRHRLREKLSFSKRGEGGMERLVGQNPYPSQFQSGSAALGRALRGGVPRSGISQEPQVYCSGVRATWSGVRGSKQPSKRFNR